MIRIFHQNYQKLIGVKEKLIGVTKRKELPKFNSTKTNCEVTKFVNKPKRMETLAFLGHLAPAFAVRGCQVKVLTEPKDFFQELCQRAEKSQERIAMAALYLGTGEKAKHSI